MHPSMKSSVRNQLSDPDRTALTSVSRNVELDQQSRPADIIVPARYPGRWVAAAVCSLLLFLFLQSVVTNPGYQWAVVWRYLLNGVVVDGFCWTIGLTIAAMTIGIV